jgi:hypothetical protein
MPIRQKQRNQKVIKNFFLLGLPQISSNSHRSQLRQNLLTKLNKFICSVGVVFGLERLDFELERVWEVGDGF